MIEIVNYVPDHLKRIKVKALHKGEVPTKIADNSITFMNGETVLAIVGGFWFAPGVFHLWGLVSCDVQKSFARAARHAMTNFIKAYKPRRIQIDIQSHEYKDLCPWAEFLGFQKEGLMRKFGRDGSDHYLYARIIS